MSWIKKQLNKLLEKEEYIDEMEELNEEQGVPIHDHRQYNEEQESSERKSSFRFPLIADNEVVTKGKPTKSEKNIKPKAKQDNQIFELPKHLQQHDQSQVYDVEVSGIRDLLERRQQGKGYSNVIRSKQAKVRLEQSTPTEKELPTKSPMREDQRINQEFINPLENRKKFVPTKVPSPVYGFNKPTPIETLMKKEELEELHNEIAEVSAVESVAEEISTNEVTESEVIMETALTEVKPEQLERLEAYATEEQDAEETEVKIISYYDLEEEEDISEQNPVQVNPIYYENRESPPILAEEVVEQAEPLNDEQVKHVTIENSTINIGKLHVEQVQQTETETATTLAETEETVQEVAVDSEAPQPTTGSRLPFNVLMLKSDKQKLEAKKLASEQFRIMKPVESIPEPQLLETFEQSSSESDLTEEIATNSFEEVQARDETIQKNEPDEVNGGFNEFTLVENEQIHRVSEPVSEEINSTEPIASDSLQPETEAKSLEPIHAVVEIGVETQTAMNPNEPVEAINEPVLGTDEVNEAPIYPIQDLFEPVESTEASIESIVDLSVSDKPADGPTEPNQNYLMEPVESTDTTFEFIQDEVMLNEPAQAKSEPAQAINEVAATDYVAIPTEPETIVPSIPIKPYVKPSLEYLSPPEEKLEDREWMEEQGERLVEALSYFQVTAQIESIVQGPAVTQFEITVGHGTKVSKVRNLSDDIKLALAAKDIRIDAPIPGKRSIGIEIPNRISRAVRLSEVTDSESFQQSESPLEAALGLDLTGRPVTLDLRKMPHGLIAGATGSGKSVCINSILVSLLYKADPHELKLMLIDPKMVELAPFNKIPHLVSPVITDVKAATAALKWAVEEMERRYQLFMHASVRDITRFNKLCEQNKQYAQKLPYMLIVIDELADLMMMSPADVEEAICRIAQKARACGIHLIVATQRPSVDVITGLIKSNIPTRIAFAVSSQIDSRTILDSQGAERLLGRGDMLYLGNGMSAPTRIQGTFVTDEEIEEIIEHVREQGEPDYIFQQEELLKKAEAAEEQDELFEEVCRFVYEQGSASTSSLQRRYHIGYNRAARLIDMLEKHGFVSEQRGSKARDVFITESDLAVQFGD